MCQPFKRREFLQLTLAGTALGLGGAGMCAWGAGPGCNNIDQSGLPAVEGEGGPALPGHPGKRLAQSEIGP